MDIIESSPCEAPEELRSELARPDEQETEREHSALYDFYDIGAFDRALKRSDFTVEEEVEILVRIMREAPTPWMQMAALKLLGSRNKEVLTAAGKLQQLVGKTSMGPDGAVKVEAKTMRLLTEASDVTGRIIEASEQRKETTPDGSNEDERGSKDEGGRPGASGRQPDGAGEGGDDDSEHETSDTRGHVPPLRREISRGLSGSMAAQTEQPDTGPVSEDPDA
jgi:hypothetical protein